MKDAANRHRRLLKWAVGMIAVLVALPVAYLLSALLGGLIPANNNWRPPKQGVTIYIETNGVHTWIAVPVVTSDMDWRRIAPASHIRDPSRAGSYIAVGYGQREFYLNTPTWGDLTPGRALGAAFGNGPTLMHVYHEPRPVNDADSRPVVLTSNQYEALSAFILAGFDRDPQGRTRPLIGRGYGSDDVFYEAIGSYNLFYTCNEWTGSALRHAGVRVGLWTPFAQSVTARF